MDIRKDIFKHNNIQLRNHPGVRLKMYVSFGMILPANSQQSRHVTLDMKLLAVVTMSSSSFFWVVTSCTSDKTRRFFGWKMSPPVLGSKG
jgi:hypothetical protein